MERRVVHNQDGLWLWPSTAMIEKLFDEVLEHASISRSLEDSRLLDTILAIRKENLVPLAPLETGTLDSCHPTGRPAYPPETSPLVTA